MGVSPDDHLQTVKLGLKLINVKWLRCTVMLCTHTFGLGDEKLIVYIVNNTLFLVFLSIHEITSTCNTLKIIYKQAKWLSDSQLRYVLIYIDWIL